MDVNKRIRFQIDEIIGEICDQYCKYREIADKKAYEQAEDLDELADKAQQILEEYCSKCPMMKW